MREPDLAQLQTNVTALTATLQQALEEQRGVANGAPFWQMQRTIGDLRHRVNVATGALLKAKIAASGEHAPIEWHNQLYYARQEIAKGARS